MPRRNLPKTGGAIAGETATNGKHIMCAEPTIFPSADNQPYPRFALADRCRPEAGGRTADPLTGRRNLLQNNQRVKRQRRRGRRAAAHGRKGIRLHVIVKTPRRSAGRRAVNPHLDDETSPKVQVAFADGFRRIMAALR